MPIGESAANVMFGIMARLSGAAQTTSGLNKIGVAERNVTRNANQAGTAATTMSTKMAKGSVMASQSMQKAAQSSFRYTFYALMAMRAGQALASAVFIKGMINAADEYTHSMTRIQATLQATTKQMDLLRAKANEVVLKTPYGPHDTAEAMRSMAKQGLAVIQIQQAMLPTANLATMGEMSLTSSAEMLTEVLRAYRMNMNLANTATAQLGYTASQSKYELTDLKSILEDVAPTAAGYGQSLDKTLQMITAFGRVGVKAEQAATMIRQGVMRAAKPDVQKFFEWGLGKMGEKSLYDEQGRMRNVGEAMVASARALDQLRKQAVESGRGADFGAAVDSMIYKLFGVRQAKGFMALSGISLDQYKKFLENIKNNADAYEKQYMETIKKDYHWARIQATATMQNLAKDLGTPMLRMLIPFKEVQAEFTGFMDKLITANSTTRALVPAILFLTGSIMGLAGALGIGVGVTFLIKTRLADVGEQLVESGRAAARFGEDTVKGMTHAQVGFRYFKSFMMGPIHALSGLSIGAGILYYAWKHNLGGLQSFLKPFFNWWQKTMINTGDLAGQMMTKLHKAFKFPNASGQGGSPLGGIAYGIQQSANTVFGRLVGGFVSGLKIIITVLKYTAIPILKFSAAVIARSFGYLAWIIGGGNIERGFRRLGNALGVLVGVKLFDVLVGKIRLFALSLYRLYGVLKVGPEMQGGVVAAYKLMRTMGFAAIHGEIRATMIARSLAVRSFGKIFSDIFRHGGQFIAPNMGPMIGAIFKRILGEPYAMIRAAYTSSRLPAAYASLVGLAHQPTTSPILRELRMWPIALVGRFRTGVVDPIIKVTMWSVGRVKWIVLGAQRAMSALRATIAALSALYKAGGIARVGQGIWRGIAGVAVGGKILGMLGRAGGGAGIGGMLLGAGKYLLIGLLIAAVVGTIIAALKGAFRRKSGSEFTSPSLSSPARLSYAPVTPAMRNPSPVAAGDINTVAAISEAFKPKGAPELTSPSMNSLARLSYAPVTPPVWSPAPELTSPSVDISAQLSYTPVTPAAWNPAPATAGEINVVTYITAPAGTTKEQAEYMAAIIESRIQEAARAAQELKTEHEQRREATKPDYWNTV